MTSVCGRGEKTGPSADDTQQSQNGMEEVDQNEAGQSGNVQHGSDANLQVHTSSQDQDTKIMPCSIIGPSGDAAGPGQSAEGLESAQACSTQTGEGTVSSVMGISSAVSESTFENSEVTAPITTASETNQIATQCSSKQCPSSSLPTSGIMSPDFLQNTPRTIIELGTSHGQPDESAEHFPTEAVQESFNVQNEHNSNVPMPVSVSSETPETQPVLPSGSTSSQVTIVDSLSGVLNLDLNSHSVRCESVSAAAGDAGSAGISESSTRITTPHILPITVRDASKESGQRDADETYNRLFLEYYHEYKDKVYRVPPLFIGHHPYVSSRRSGDLQCESRETFQVYGTTKSDVKGDEAERIVACCIEDLLNLWVADKYPAFIITSYQFENFCNKTNVPPDTDKNRYVKPPADGSNDSPQPKDGEHDLVIVHYRYGLIFIQVKSCEETTDPNNTVKKAMEQTEADEAFFRSNFDDLNINVSVKTAIALPDVVKSKMEKGYKNCYKRICNFHTDGLERCLMKDDLPRKTDSESTIEEKKVNLVKWWEKITRDSHGFRSYDEYKRVVARYIGFKSTVMIPVTQNLCQVGEHVGRSHSGCVSEIGNRYMNIVLTPQQVYILNTNLPRLIIRGDYGTGKTVLLILKVRTMIKELRRVCVISMSLSPLIHILETSIKYDMNPAYYNYISFQPALDQTELKEIVEDCAERRLSIFLDEFPSVLFESKSLQKTIQDFPSDLLFWCVMSHERHDRMSRGPQRLFSLFHQPDLRFKEVILKKILRFPPSVQSLLPKDSSKLEKVLFQYLKQSLDLENTKRKMADYFHSLGLSTQQTIQILDNSPPESSLTWSDVVVLESEPVQREFYSKLVKLKIPLLRTSSVVQFSMSDVDNVKSGLTNKSAYTCSIEGFQNVQRVADIAGTDCAIYIRHSQNGQVVQIDNTNVAIARFLHENGFINEDIIKTSQMTQIERNMTPRKWCDVIFLDRGEVQKPKVFSFLQSLGIPLVTPSSRNDIITENAVLYTNKNNFEGFQRKESITFSERKDLEKGKVIANVEENICVEGPEIIYVDHINHTGPVEICDLCKDTVEKALEELGLLKIQAVRSHREQASRPPTLEAGSDDRYSVQTSETLLESQNILALAKYPRQDITFADLVILDDRQKPKSAVSLFQRCGIPVVDRLDAEVLDAEEAFSSETRVLYMKTAMFKGLERKVVVVIKSPNELVFSMTNGGMIPDSVELAITRCASQLIVIST